MNDKKTNGQIAYETYCGATNWKSLVNGKPLPQWPEVKPEIQAAWEEVGKAFESNKLIAAVEFRGKSDGELRDEFAKEAMNALITKWGITNTEAIAKEAYKFADEMMKQRL